MAVTVKYQILFSIDVLHHFFLDDGKQHFESMSPEQKVKQLGNYDVRNFLEIIPSKDCQALMRNLRLIYRNTATGVIIGTPTNEAGNRPVFEIPEDAKFTFILKLNSGSFYNATNLSLKIDRNEVYYFSNLGQTDAEILNLSKTPATFQGGSTYESGRFVLSANGRELFTINKNTANAANTDLDKDTVADTFSNNADYEKGAVVVRTIGGIDRLFESKIDNPNDTPADAPGNDWKKLRDLPLNYVNANDLITLQGSLFDFTLPSNTINVTATLSAITPNGNQVAQVDNFTSGTSRIQLDWRTQPLGLYTLQISNDDLPNNDPAKVIYASNFYLGHAMQLRNAFASIDIFVSRADDNNYALLNADGTFQNKENQFVIRLKNRSTVWRYIFNESQSLQGNSELSIEDTNDKILVTNTRQPLTANGTIDVQLGDLPLPNANSTMIKPEATNIFSEIYIYQ